MYKVLISPHCHQYLLPVFNSHPSRCTVVLICIPLTTNDIEHLFMCLYLYFWTTLFTSFAHFLTGLFAFLLLSYKNYLHILDMSQSEYDLEEETF